MSKNAPCPICRLNIAERQDVIQKDAIFVDCRRCGRFYIEGRLFGEFESSFNQPGYKELLPYLSAYTRQFSEAGSNCEVDTTNWKNLARSHRSTSVSRKFDRLLKLIADRSARPGDEVKIDWYYDSPLIDAYDTNEINYFLQHGEKLGFLRSIDLLEFVLLTIDGWKHLEQQATSGGIPGRCFMAMWFDDSMDDAYNTGIYPALKEDCGLDPLRIDRVEHNEKIDDKIIMEIRSSQILVADFTGQRQGVYFEAGYAMGIGRPVIWACKDADLQNAHFDTRQYNHISWTDPQDLRVKLANRIKATILK